MKSFIDLENLIKDSGLSKFEIACRLFPSNKFPEASLQRVIKGDSYLDTQQIILLSNMLNVPVVDIFENTWKSNFNKGLHVLTNGDYKAVLDIENRHTRIYHKETLFFDTILHSVSIPLDEYLEILNKQIEKHNQI